MAERLGQCTEFQTVLYKSQNIKIVHIMYSRSSRKEETVVTARLGIRHSLLTHSYMLKKKPIPICTCQAPLTVNHLVAECSIYEHKYRPIQDIRPALQNDTGAINKLIYFFKYEYHKVGIYNLI